MAIVETPSHCLPGHAEHSHMGAIVKSNGQKIEQYYCPRCQQVVTITRTGVDAPNA